LQLTRCVARALGRDGITVNAIAPGSVLSERGWREFEALPVELRERVLAETPLGRFARAEEIASIAVFLASEDASYITGARPSWRTGLVLDVDLGWLAGACGAGLSCGSAP